MSRGARTRTRLGAAAASFLLLAGAAALTRADDEAIATRLRRLIVADEVPRDAFNAGRLRALLPRAPVFSRSEDSGHDVAYLTSGLVQANITPDTAVVAYAPEGRAWGDEYLTEKVETRAGWQFPSPEEDWMRGYPQEPEDFVAAITERREPLSGGALARDVVEVIYAGYLSAETGRRVDLAR